MRSRTGSGLNQLDSMLNKKSRRCSKGDVVMCIKATPEEAAGALYQATDRKAEIKPPFTDRTDLGPTT